MIRRPTRAGLVAIFAAVVFAVPSAFAQDFEVDSVFFVPASFYVGDPVELRVTLRVVDSSRVSVPETMPTMDWLDLGTVEVHALRNDLVEVRIPFTSFAPGTRTLPDLKLGDIVLTDLRIHTLSVLSENAESLTPPLGQTVLPSTWWYVGGIGLGLVFGPWMIVLLFVGARRWIGGAISARILQRPYKRVTKIMKAIQDEIPSAEEFYTRVIGALRAYLGHRGGDDYAILTTGEIVPRIEQSYSDPEVRAVLGRVFRTGDLVRFGGKRVGRDMLESEISSVRRVLKLAEAEFMRGRENDRG